MTRTMPQYDIWHTPASDYPRIQIGSMRLHDYRYTRGYYRMSGLLDSALFQVKQAIRITGLQERIGHAWKTWMVDDPPHWEAMRFYASASHGHVLTTGLGLGLVVHSLAENPRVESVTVVEKSPDVIALVGNYVPSCTIVEADFYEFIRTTGINFDTCIIDLWTAHDLPSKKRAFAEAASTYTLVRMRWPKATLFFHGFPSLCNTLWPMSDQTRRDLAFLAGNESRG